MLVELLANGFEGNTWVINQEVEGLIYAESLIQPPYHGNCLNWVVGHIVQSRCRVLDLLGEPSIWDDVQRARYASGSDPVTGEGENFSRLRPCWLTSTEPRLRSARPFAALKKPICKPSRRTVSSPSGSAC